MKKQNYEVIVDGSLSSEAGKFSASFSSSSFVGHAKLYYPYRDYLWNKFNTEGIDVLIRAGIGGKTNLFRGMIDHPLIDQQKYIILELNDYGQNFRRSYTGRYKDKSLERVLTELGAECDYTTILDDLSPSTLDTKISRNTSIEYGEFISYDENVITGDINGTISGLFKSSCNNCASIYSDKFYITTIQDYCPNCTKYGSMIVDETTEANKYKCDNCKAEYCGIDGYQTNLDGQAKLKILNGPIEATIDNLGGDTSYSSSTTTYEDEIRSICEAYGLYPYLTQYKELYIKEYRGTPYPDVSIDINDVQYKTRKFINTTSQTIKEVIVNYDNGTIAVSEDGYNSVGQIVLDRPDLDRSKAEDLAAETLKSQLQNMTSELYLTVIARTDYSAGSWARVPSFSNLGSKYSTVMYIDSMTSAMEEGGAIIKDVLTLKYSPEITERVSDIANSTSITMTFEQIMEEAAKFTYSTVCNDYSCINSKRRGDSKAMSDWLYTKLTLIGKRVRVISFDSLYLSTSNFYCVQQHKNGTWYDLPYESYNFDGRFIPTDIRTNLRIVEGS